MTIERPMFPPRAESVHTFSPQAAIGLPESGNLTSESGKAAEGMGRRSILAALAFLPAALPVAAEAASDPIYAAIEQHKALSVAFSAAVARPDYAQVVVAEPEVEDFVDAAGEALCSGADRLLALQALTLPGLAVMLRYLSGLEDWQLPGRFANDGRERVPLPWCCRREWQLESRA